MGQIEIIRDIGGINDLCIIKPAVHRDSHGCFMETYNQNDMKDAGLCFSFVQDNESKSSKGVLRGLHIQRKFPQGKLVSVIQGSVYDVAVDLRKESATYGKWFGIELSEENKLQFYIPEGFAHGFYVMSETAKFFYKVTQFWHPSDEIGIPWDDPILNIQWPIDDKSKLIIAEKDKHYMPFNESTVYQETSHEKSRII